MRPARLAFAAFVAVGLTLCGCGGHKRRLGPDLPVLNQLQPGSIYMNDAARVAALTQQPGLLTEDDRSANSERVRLFAQATQDPKLWRKLDRKHRFDAILLAGDPAAFQTLLDHLLETKDWKLAFLDAESLMFCRPPCTEWKPGDLATVRKTIETEPPTARGSALARLAGNLLAVRQIDLAKDVLDQAIRADSNSAEIWVAMSIYHAKMRLWEEALADAQRALGINKSHLPALMAKAQLLLTMNRCEEALPLARELVRSSPRDPATLYLHAKIAHGAHDYRAEIESLNLLVEMAEKAGQAPTGYRIYLAQAYATIGEAEPALAHLERALADPEISKDQRAFCEDAVQRIKSRVKL